MLNTMQKKRLETTFVKRLGPQRASTLYLIKTADDHDRPCWFLMQTDPVNALKLQHTSPAELVNLTKYGKMLAAGWGHEPDKRALDVWCDQLHE